MKIARQYLRRFLFCDEFCSFLARNRDAVNKENLIMLRKLSVLGAGLMGVMTLFAFLFPYLYRMQTLYPPYFIAYALICAIAFTKAGKRRAYQMATACAIVLVTAAFGMHLGIFYTRNGNANLYMVFLIIMPMLFITTPLFTRLFAFAVCAVFSVLTLLFKDVAHYEIDITNCWVCYVISMVGTHMINTVRMENIDARRRLYGEALIDGLTQLNNRRAFTAYMETLHPKLLTDAARVTVYMIDIDIFKIFNDTYGHVEGDRCLVELGDIFRSLSSRYGLFIARYGGEEFIAVSADAALDAEAVGQAIVDEVFDKRMSFATSPYGRVTVSVGCADSRARGGNNDFDLINNADVALYRAKERGRNRFCMFGV
ncbi:MAG: diguanylate cyclase [Eubacteriales bacterium]|nr:diguanylate cyclase [Eubacteriales bacterium]